MSGASRSRRKNGKVYHYPGYVCTANNKYGGCKQVAIPRDGLESAVLRLLDEHVFSEQGKRQLEATFRRVLREHEGNATSDRYRMLAVREKELAQQIAQSSRRLLEVPEELMDDVRNALVALKAEHEGIRTVLVEEDQKKGKRSDGDKLLRECLEEVDSLEQILKDPNVSLERRRHALAQLLRAENGQRPMVADFDFDAGRGWRKALQKVTVSHVSLCLTTVAPEMVAGTRYHYCARPLLKCFYFRVA